MVASLVEEDKEKGEKGMGAPTHIPYPLI